MTQTRPTWPYQPPPDDLEVGKPHIWLRLLETSDIHGHVVPFDYDRNQAVTGYSLARIASLIETARAESVNTLLFDNGDFLQGSPFSDFVACSEFGWDQPNPVIAAMNALDYSAVNLGNHEFNFGLDWLKRTLDEATFPVLCANAAVTPPDSPIAPPAPFAAPSLLLPCQLHDAHGQSHDVTIGLVGLLPPQITTWDHVHLHDRVKTRGIVETARHEVAGLRRAGADIVVILAHSGIGPPVPTVEDADPMMENAALTLAKLPGVDAILAGHSHEVFPDPAVAHHSAEVDHKAGTLAGIPAVMPGYRGSHLGVLDLCLVAKDDGWTVCASHSVARPVHVVAADAPAPPHPDIMAISEDAHRTIVRKTSQPLTRLKSPLHSYFAQVKPCTTLQLVLDAKQQVLTRALAATPHADLPCLAATACFKAGGHAGPEYFTEIPAGPLSLGNLVDLYPFPNTLIGLRLTGADILDWLERAASCFNQIKSNMGDTPQPLWNPAFASNAFDTFSDLSYRIDLSQPPRFDDTGGLIHPSASRIRDLTYLGGPVLPDMEFCVATNNFRAFGGGPFNRSPDNKIIFRGQRPIRQDLLDYLRGLPSVDATHETQGWCLDGPQDAILLLETGPGVLNHPDRIATLQARDMGTNPRGFVQLAIPLSAITHLANPAQPPYVSA